MVLIYEKTTGEVFRTVDRVETGGDGILYGYVGEGKVGYHPSCNPAVYEMSEEMAAGYDPEKQYLFDGEKLSVIVPEPTAEEQIAALEAELTATQLALCDVYEMLTGGEEDG